MKNNDNEKLLKLQEKFLRGDSSAWSELWLLSLDVCKRIIIKEKEKKGFFLNEDDLADKSINAVEYVLRRYKKNYKDGRKYQIKKNFISALYFGVIHSLYYYKESDKAFCDILLFDDEIIKNLKSVAVYDKRKIKVKLKS